MPLGSVGHESEISERRGTLGRTCNYRPAEAAPRARMAPAAGPSGLWSFLLFVWRVAWNRLDRPKIARHAKGRMATRHFGGGVG